MSNRVTATLEWMAALAAQGSRGLEARVTVSREEYNEWAALVPRSITGLSVARGPVSRLEMWGPGRSRVVILEETGDEE